MRYILGALLIVLGTLKISEGRRFAVAYSRYDILAGFSHNYALAFPYIEVFLGCLYFISRNWLLLVYVTFLFASINLFSLIQRARSGGLLHLNLQASLIPVSVPYFLAMEGVIMCLMSFMILFAF